jgi:hypothetical protein
LRHAVALPHCHGRFFRDADAVCPSIFCILKCVVVGRLASEDLTNVDLGRTRCGTLLVARVWARLSPLSLNLSMRGCRVRILTGGDAALSEDESRVQLGRAQPTLGLRRHRRRQVGCQLLDFQ